MKIKVFVYKGLRGFCCATVLDCQEHFSRTFLFYKKLHLSLLLLSTDAELKLLIKATAQEFLNF
jgi:hypothetical protein